MLKNRGVVERALRVTPFLLATGILAVYLIAGDRPAIGFAAGGSLSYTSLFVANLVVRKSIHEGTSKVAALSSLQLLFVAKLPIFGIVIFFTNSLGFGAIEGFLGGYGLVYLALVWGALLQKDAPRTTSDE